MLGYSWIAAALFAIAGFVLGAVVHSRLHTWQNRRRRAFPEDWPLEARTIVNPEERDIWLWLKTAFPDQNVLVKTAISRFTNPRDKNQARLAAELLEGMYCTFAVATHDGTVIGCIDIPGRAGLLRSHRDLKETILSNAGIGYAVVRASNLPTAEAIRAAFMGEFQLDGPDIPDTIKPDVFTEELDDFSRSFQEKSRIAARLRELGAVDPANEPPRKKRQPYFNPLMTHTGVVDKYDKRVSPDADLWNDSFMAHDNSRRVPRPD